MDGTDMVNEGKNSSEDKNTMKAFCFGEMKEFNEICHTLPSSLL